MDQHEVHAPWEPATLPEGFQARVTADNAVSVVAVSTGNLTARAIAASLQATGQYRCRVHGARSLTQQSLMEAKAELVLIELDPSAAELGLGAARWLREIEFPGAVVYCVPAEEGLSVADSDVPAPHGFVTWPCPVSAVRLSLRFALARSEQERQQHNELRRACRALRRIRDLANDAPDGRPSLAPASVAADPDRASELSKRLEELSPREREVFDQAVRGSALESISQALFISPHTARNHLASIYRKLGVGSRLELTATFLGYMDAGSEP